MNEGTESLLNFFGLREQPFAATADPAYFYATRPHRECLFRIWNAIDERHGITVVLGNYGTGKTTLLRKFLTGVRANPQKYNTAVIGSPIPSWTSYSLLENIITQFKLRPAERSFVAAMEALNGYLLANRKRITTLVIDDAQNLNKRGQLELLRLAQNLETPQHKLLNLLFFAQMEWARILRAAPNFLQRVSLTYTLDTIGTDEVAHMIQFRLRQAGAGSRGPVFDESAIRAIHAYTEGSPRLIITLCRNALLLAAHLRTRQIGQAIILHTIQKTMLPDAERQTNVAALVAAPHAPQMPLEGLPPAPIGEESARGTPSHAARANRMLLRAARQTAARTMFTENR